MSSQRRGHDEQPTGQERRRNEPTPLGQPTGDLDLPFFSYGSFSPNQLAFAQIEGFGPMVDEALLRDHHLLIRDGLPLLVSGGLQVFGTVIRFPRKHAPEAYARIGAFEPAEQYAWGEVEIGATRAWACFGRDPESGTAFVEPTQRWSCADDPALAYGLPETRDLIELALEPIGRPPIGHEPNWSQFFRLQAAYVLLWTIVERVATFRYGAVGGTRKRVEKVEKEPEVMAVVARLGVPARGPYRPLYDVLGPHRPPITIERSGAGAFSYWYRVRCSVAHRGKAGLADWRLLGDCTTDLYNTLVTLLQGWLPELRESWGGEAALLPERLPRV